jgi:hypothetical protein
MGGSTVSGREFTYDCHVCVRTADLLPLPPEFHTTPSLSSLVCEITSGTGDGYVVLLDLPRVSEWRFRTRGPL